MKETEHGFLYGDRIGDERAANRQGSRMEAFERRQIRESEERTLIPYGIVSLVLIKEYCLRIDTTCKVVFNPLFKRPCVRENGGGNPLTLQRKSI
jgi:hypothetical protein